MFTITVPVTSAYRVKGSKFLGYLRPVSVPEDASRVMDEIKSEHPSATHHCYAYRLDPHQAEEFEQDDGEPRGTAGLPILNQMRSQELMNCILAVVRYYGGTKLGKPGLVEAYSQTASLCIERAVLRKINPLKLYQIEYSYPDQGLIDKLKNDFPLIVLEAGYQETATLLMGCPVSETRKFERVLKSLEHRFKKVDKKGDSFSTE